MYVLLNTETHTHGDHNQKPTIELYAKHKIWSKRRFHFPMWMLFMLQRAQLHAQLKRTSMNI